MASLASGKIPSTINFLFPGSWDFLRLLFLLLDLFHCFCCRGCCCLALVFGKDDVKHLHFFRLFLPSWVKQDWVTEDGWLQHHWKAKAKPTTYSVETLVGYRWHRSVWSSLWLSLRVHPCVRPCPWPGSPRGTPPWLPYPCWEGLFWWYLDRGAENITGIHL